MERMGRVSAMLGFSFLLIMASAPFVFADSVPLQDFCVADLNNTVRVNGYVCKDPAEVTAEDFFFSGLHNPQVPTTPIGSVATHVNVKQVGGLNTQGLAMVRIDYGPYGQNAPHYHPRGSEIIVVLEGTLLVGFITSNPENRLLSKVLNKGDAFVFPQGLIHFQFNMGNTPAAAMASLNSQSPGTVTVGNAVFASNPAIPVTVLDRAFHVDKKTVELIQSKF
ncbi:hypothetical protein H6P81_020202 [Aristolochia fimbriata]|uniref:Germin-like protein n=1 Tax=Aristolochia fimbriata TaxID=158543 RepID=A0AAV7DXU2_ARIFI|nr:hypothetical protein H6P81_020202 [Aristolochia fimbriata]